MAEGGSRGWAAVLGLTVLTMLLSVVQPFLLIFVPFALLLLGIPPHRPLLFGLGMVLVFVSFVGPPSNALWYMERGWALLVGGWFVAATAFLPEAGFLARGMTSVVASFGTAAALFAWNRGAFAEIDGLLADRLQSEATVAIESWRTYSWYTRIGEQLDRAVYGVAEWRATLFPALLALASLCALAVAWWGCRRMNREPSRPLAPLREFRFHDGLIWLLVVGIALVVLPISDLAERAGSNLLTFMAALYALRGVAVLLVLGGAPGPLGVAVGTAALLLLYPIVVVATVLVGLSDTWLDIRTRRRTPQEPGA